MILFNSLDINSAINLAEALFSAFLLKLETSLIIVDELIFPYLIYVDESFMSNSQLTIT